MDIGSRIKSLLDSKDMNQMALAKLLGKPPVYVHNILKKKTLDTGKLAEIAKVLDVPITYFFSEADDINKGTDCCINQYSGNKKHGCPFGLGSGIGVAEHKEAMAILTKQLTLLEQIVKDVNSIKQDIEEK